MESVAYPPTSSDSANDHGDAPRKPVAMRAHLRNRGARRFGIDLVDLSVTGFHAETSFTLWPGSVVWLTLPGFAPLEAVVVWRDKVRYECAFSRPLHPAVFDHIVALGGSRG